MEVTKIQSLTSIGLTEGSTHLYPVTVSSNPKSAKGHGSKVGASISKLSEPTIS